MSTSEHYLPAGLPAPVDSDGIAKPYWDGARQNRLLVQRCNDCQGWQWGPEWICHRCHSLDLGFEEVAPRGVLYSWERVWHPVHPALKGFGPYLVGLVELPQAGLVRMVGNILGDPAREPRIGETMTASFEHHPDESAGGFTLVHWQPAG